ncbi:hypothetical protein L21SP2_1696 [Salinispira pacifica]|uniref:Uncharacterized protein n=1 Tax=Salinispira pacifica TaxID=1307761 RepID=V5WHS2_9SPIO|nr:hypothetical protein L21SP2_1696 [Salinispira pacifica]
MLQGSGYQFMKIPVASVIVFYKLNLKGCVLGTYTGLLQ